MVGPGTSSFKSIFIGVVAAASCLRTATAWGHGRPDPMAAREAIHTTPLPHAPLDPTFINWETPHVHPMDMTPDGTRLLAVNTADNRLEVFDITTGAPVKIGSVPVGLDPVSVRARSNSEAWVISHISDAANIVDLGSMNVVRTLRTDDEPADVVFSSTPARAFVSCSQANTVQVFDLANLTAAPTRISLAGEDPRAMVFHPSRNEIYVAIFESGNHSTILGGGLTINNGFPPNVVSHASGPYGGVNPPPNDGPSFKPPQNGANPAPPPVGLIVKKNAAGQWMDDNSGNWTALVTGANAGLSGRPVGWDLWDHDVAIIDASTLAVRYADGIMNLCMAMARNPTTDELCVVGTDATNEVRFEPVLEGRFLRVNLGRVNPATGAVIQIKDLNSHLTYGTNVPFVSIPQSERNKSLGDPRGLVWNAAGSRGYVAGMGSNNVVIIDAAGNRLPAVADPGRVTIAVGEGPTGLVLDESRGRLYVLNKFGASVSYVNLATESELGRANLFDPTPASIRTGRKHLYNTHLNSGLGHIACASCHVDARMDRLAWDLGAPSGLMKPFNQNCGSGGCQDWHPMKGPMTTQTLQDIIGKEPHHWRGDRDGIEEFAGAFRGLQGGDAPLSSVHMQEFEDFLETIFIPPNPHRTFTNQLPTNMPLPGHFTTGRFGPAGLPLPNGNAANGLTAYRTAQLDGVNCVSCHTVPTGAGTDTTLVGGQFQPIPPGPNGERHLALVSVDGSTNVSIKVPHLRNQYEKTGFELTQTRNVAGFGFLHDGSVDSIARFLNEPVFNVTSNQMTADLVALMLAFGGSGFPPPPPPPVLPEPPGVASRDTHSAVGRQTTLINAATAPADQLQLIADMISLANSNAVGLIVKGRQAGIARGYRYNGGNVFQSDRQGQTITAAALQASAAPGSELTYLVVPKGTETRIGIDRDRDGFFDRDELDLCSDPANAASVPGSPLADIDGDGDEDETDITLFVGVLTGDNANPEHATRSDFNCDGQRDGRDIRPFLAGYLTP